MQGLAATLHLNQTVVYLYVDVLLFVTQLCVAAVNNIVAILMAIPTRCRCLLSTCPNGFNAAFVMSSRGMLQFQGKAAALAESCLATDPILFCSSLGR